MPVIRTKSLVPFSVVLLPLSLTACQSAPKELKPETIAEFNKPGIVLVQVNHEVRYTVAKPEPDQDRIAALTNVLRQKIESGQVSTEADAKTWLINELLRNPSQYVRPGQKTEDKTEVAGTGTGFVIAPGTIATAAHVVSNEGKKIKRELGRTALKKLTIATCEGFFSNIKNKTEQQVNDCINGFADYYSENIRLGEIQTRTAVVMQSAMPGQDSRAKVLPSEIKKAGKNLPKEDVALLTVSGGENLPILQLASSADTVAGQKVISIGFPGNITELFTKDKNLPEPTLTSGNVSAIQDQLIQTEASVSPGNSGGPLFNDRGEVIGIASFITRDEQGKSAGGNNFFVPVATLNQLIQETGITPAQNDPTKTYHKAIASFQDKQFNNALNQFKDVQDRNPEFPYIQQKISQTKQKVSSEPATMPSWIYGVAIGGGVLAIGSLLGKRLMNRSRTLSS